MRTSKILNVTIDYVETEDGSFPNPLKLVPSPEQFQTYLEKFKCFFHKDTDKFFTLTEAAKYLNLSLNTLRNMDKDGRLTPIRTEGGHRRYKQSDLDEYIQKRKDAKSMKKIKK